MLGDPGIGLKTWYLPVPSSAVAKEVGRGRHPTSLSRKAMLLEFALLLRRRKLPAAHCIEVTVEDDLHIPAIPEHQPPVVALLADRPLPTHPTDSSAVLADLLAVASSSGHSLKPPSRNVIS